MDTFVESCSFKHRPYFSKDKRLLKLILEASINGTSVETINNTIRLHFSELTQRFLQPVNRYFESLIIGNPSLMNLDILQVEPQISHFKQDEFLKSIEHSSIMVNIGPSIPLFSKRPLIDFYRAFLKSPNFASYLKQRTSDVYRSWRSQYLQILCTSDLKAWIDKQNDTIEIIDLLMRLRDELAKYSKFFVVENEIVRYSYISIKKFEEIVEPLEHKVEEIQKNWNINDGDGVDLSSPECQEIRNPRHLKAKTAPLPSKSWSSLADRGGTQSPTIRDSAIIDTSTPFPTNPTEFLNKIKKSKVSKTCLVPFGEFIPSVDQYSQLLSQSNLLIAQLPADLRHSF